MLVEVVVEGFELDFAKVLKAMIHGRAFKTSTIYPFAFLIF